MDTLGYRRYAKFPSVSPPLSHVCALYVLFSTALLSVLFSSFSPRSRPLASRPPLIFFSPTPRRPPSCSCIFCCLLQPRTTVRRESILSRPWRPRASVATRSRYGQLSAAIAKVLSAGYRGDGEAGGWRLGGLLEPGYGLRAEGEKRGGMRGRGDVRTLCQELSASGKNSIPRVKGDDALFRAVQPRR